MIPCSSDSYIPDSDSSSELLFSFTLDRYIDGLMQQRRNPIANALELHILLH